MHALIVYAHPEPRSFNAVLRDVAVTTLTERGYEVEVSDLYAMKFKAVLDRDDFTTVRDAGRFNVTLEQRHAAAHHGLAPDIVRELAKLQRTDFLILQFPMWWFNLPAILKGWIDRVFISGIVYGRNYLFDQGKLKGKKAMVSTTTGGSRELFGPGSLNGDMLELLQPLHRGVLGFCGMTVLPPFICHHVPYAGYEERQAMLLNYRDRLRSLDAMAPLPMPVVSEHLAALDSTRKAIAG